jgi:hypothetical protein
MRKLPLPFPAHHKLKNRGKEKKAQQAPKGEGFIIIAYLARTDNYKKKFLN